MITAAGISSLIFYVAIVEFMHRTTDRAVLDGDGTLVRFVFFGLAVATVFATQVIRAMMMRGEDNDAAARLRRLVRVNVITSGLAGGPATLGLVLFLVWNRYGNFYILAFISLYLLGRHFPRLGYWERSLKEMGD